VISRAAVVAADLYALAAPNAEAFVRAWLLPLADDPALVGSKRWEAGMGLPYRLVTRLGGDCDLIGDGAVVRVHTFAATYTAAARAADDTHRRMLLLAENPLADVVMGDGSVANCSSLDRATAPTHQEYGAETVVERFICEYAITLRFT
jgi:hypothetical protein